VVMGVLAGIVCATIAHDRSTTRRMLGCGGIGS
jgi:hypothetical protein